MPDTIRKVDGASDTARGRRSGLFHQAQVIDELKLTARDTAAVVDALLNPTPVNDRLRETVRLYLEAINR